MRRLAAAAGAASSLLAALWTALFALVATALLRVPDADPRLDGDPCCPHPDTWGDVAIGAGAVAILALVVSALLVLTWTLAAIAASGSPPPFVQRHARSLRLLSVAGVLTAFAAWTLLGVHSLR
jgi:hypothetical protein